MRQTGDVSHFISRLQVRREVPPISFIDDDLSVLTYRNQKAFTESQIGIEIKPNTIEKRKIRTAKWRSTNPESPKIWLQNNREKMLKFWRDYRRSPRGKEAMKRWRENNREKYNSYQLEWLNRNREKRRKRQAEINADRYQNDPIYREKKKAKNRKAYHKHKEKMIEQHGVEGWKKIQNEKYLKRKQKNESSKS